MNGEMIVDALRSVRSGLVDAAQSIRGVEKASPVASPEAVSRFEAAMAAPPVEESAKIEAIPFADQMAAAWRTAQDDHQGLVHRIRALSTLNGEEGITVAQLSELQYSMATLSFHQEVVAKVADKASNAIQTLIKNQ
jgi:hypothetical protein